MVLTIDFRDKLCKLLKEQGITYYYSNIKFKKISLEDYNKTKAKLEILGDCLEISIRHHILDIDYSSEAVGEYLKSKYGLEVIKTSDNHIALDGGTSNEQFMDSCFVGIEKNGEKIDVYIYDTAFIAHENMGFCLIHTDGYQMVPVNTYDLSEVDFDETLEISYVLRDIHCKKLILPDDIFGSSKQRRSLISPFKNCDITILDLTNTSFEYTNAARDLFVGLNAKTLKLGTLDLSHMRNSVGNFGYMFNNCEINNIIIDKIIVADDYMRSDFIHSITSSRDEDITAINFKQDTLLNNEKKLRKMIEVVSNKTKNLGLYE